jgi:hypothetical protein
MNTLPDNVDFNIVGNCEMLSKINRFVPFKNSKKLQEWSCVSVSKGNIFYSDIFKGDYIINHDCGSLWTPYSISVDGSLETSAVYSGNNYVKKQIDISYLKISEENWSGINITDEAEVSGNLNGHSFISPNGGRSWGSAVGFLTNPNNLVQNIKGNIYFASVLNEGILFVTIPPGGISVASDV